MKPIFTPGENIAMKVPTRDFDKTVTFYRDLLGFEGANLPSSDSYESVPFKFGSKILWIDKIAGIDKAEIWLEIQTDDVDLASRYFAEHSVTSRDDVEPLPEGFKGFWIANPADIIHLISE